MTHIARRVIAGIGITAMTMGAAATIAQAGANDSAKGSVKSPGVNITFDAKTDANGNSTGTFTGEVRVGAQIMEAMGPVTCLDVVGNKIGIFYPVTASKPLNLMTAGKSGVYMNITTDGKGNAKSISYSVIPFKQKAGCKPAPTFIPASGKVTSSG